MQIEVFESAPSALNQLVRVRGDGAQPGGPGGRVVGCGRTGARAPGLSSSSLQHKIVLKTCIHPTLSMTIPPAPNSYSMLTRI